MNAMRDRREHFVEALVPVPNRSRAVDVNRRADVARDSLEGDALAMHDRVYTRKSGRQYALAHTASTMDEPPFPHFRHVEGVSADRNSSSGSTRIVALVSSLISDSQSTPPHHPAYTNPPFPSINARKSS